MGDESLLGDLPLLACLSVADSGTNSYMANKVHVSPCDEGHTATCCGVGVIAVEYDGGGEVLN